MSNLSVCFDHLFSELKLHLPSQQNSINSLTKRRSFKNTYSKGGGKGGEDLAAKRKFQLLCEIKQKN